jgi:hypothetical protein
MTDVEFGKDCIIGVYWLALLNSFQRWYATAEGRRQCGKG